MIGIELSKTALELAKTRALELGLKIERQGPSNNSIDYRLGDIGDSATYSDIQDSSVDLILDVTSSNSLDERGREVYLKECARILARGGYMFVRALCKDGNKNVKNLLKDSPGKEHDTYILREIDLTERVFSREDFTVMYSQYFKILNLEKKTGYTTFNDRIYKRDYWIAYLQSK